MLYFAHNYTFCMHLYHILYNLYRKNIVIDQFKKIVEWKFLKKVTMVTSNQKSSKQGPPLKLNFNMGQFSSLFSEFWLLGSFLAIFSKKLEFCTSRQTFFTVNPVVSSHGCTLNCKFFLSLHTTYINIRGDCQPGVLLSVYILERIFMWSLFLNLLSQIGQW